MKTLSRLKYGGVPTICYGFSCWYTSKYVVYSSGVISSWCSSVTVENAIDSPFTILRQIASKHHEDERL